KQSLSGRAAFAPPHAGLFAFLLAQRDWPCRTGIGRCQRLGLLLLWLLRFPVSAFFVAFSHHDLTDAAGFSGEAVFEGGIAFRFQLYLEGRGLPGLSRNSFKSNCFLGDE
ncbi:MAG: hypothetical protein KJO78_01615, partial [Alphaproteobacteria bacterium]|nr:hypothetical protein [Alphaproteobacteria bacterium]